MPVDRAAVAERLTLECGSCVQPSTPGPTSVVCPDCTNGVRKPLQQACPGEPDYDGGRCVCNMGLTSDAFPKRRRRCYECEGRGWLPNDDYDTLLEAIRAKGWGYNITSFPPGDRVWIGMLALSAVIEPDDGLRGTEAIWAALERVPLELLGVEGVVENSNLP